MTETDWRAELSAKTTEALGRYGVAGRVEVEQHLVWLIGHGPTVEVAVSESDISRARQSAADLQGLAERLAKGLSAARRSSARKSVDNSGWADWLRVVPPLGLAGLGIWAAAHYLLPHHSTPSDSFKPASTVSRSVPGHGPQPRERQQQDYQSCLGTVSRVQQGGSVTTMDVDGWVIELSLISDQPSLGPTSSELNKYFKFKPTGSGIERLQHMTDTPIINGADADQAGVVISKDPLASAVAGGQSGVLVTWRGQYVNAYFQQQSREEYRRTAEVLFTELQARYGALYARCAQGTARYLGSWYRGPDVGAALAILVAEMEVFADVSQIPDIKVGDGTNELRSPLAYLAERLGPVSERGATLLLSNSGGIRIRAARPIRHRWVPIFAWQCRQYRKC